MPCQKSLWWTSNLNVFSAVSPFSKPYQSGFRAKHSIISATSSVINDIVSTALIKIIYLLIIDLSRILKQRIISCFNQNDLPTGFSLLHVVRKLPLTQEAVCYNWRCEILVFSYFQGCSSRFCLGPLIVYVYWWCCKILGSPCPSLHYDTIFIVFHILHLQSPYNMYQKIFAES